MSAPLGFPVRAAAKLATPLALLFAIYVLANGSAGAGSGVAAGALGAGALIAHALVFGLEAAARVAHPALLRAGAALGLAALVGLGLSGVAGGQALFDFTPLAQTPGPPAWRLGAGLLQGALAVVTLCVFTLLFLAFAGRAGELKDPAG